MSTHPHPRSQLPARRRSPGGSHQSLVERFASGEQLFASAADTDLSRMHETYRSRQRLDEQLAPDLDVMTRRIDKGRLPFTAPLLAFEWPSDVVLDVWTHDRRLYVARVASMDAPRLGVASGLDTDHRFTVRKRMREAIGLFSESATVHLVLDRARKVVIIEDPLRMVTRAYSDLYRPMLDEEEQPV